MGRMLWKQLGVCVMMVLALVISTNSGVAVLENGAASVMRHMSVNYTTDTVKAAADKGKAVAASATGKVGDALNVITGKPVYGAPIDEAFDGKKVPVYAVAGGQVIAVGENEEIGRYVRIIHGNQAESLYGNLRDVNVSVPANVKKGQIIGIYEKNNKKDFYYSLKEKD